MATDDSHICIAPLSSPFSLLPRAHTYALAAALIIPGVEGWLFRAALAAFTTRTAIFAVDAAVLLSAIRNSPDRPAEADALVVLDALGLAAVVACWQLLVSTRESSARPLIRLWAFVVGIGCILAFVAVTKLGQEVESVGTGDCEAGSSSLTRLEWFGSSERVAVLGVIGTNINWFVKRVGISGLISAVLAIISSTISGSRTRGQVPVDIEQNALGEDGRQHEANWEHFRWAGRLIMSLLSVALPSMAILIVVSTEQYLSTVVPAISAVEPMTSVGQWGVWAATGVVVVATFVNAVREKNGLTSKTDVESKI